MNSGGNTATPEINSVANTDTPPETNQLDEVERDERQQASNNIITDEPSTLNNQIQPCRPCSICGFAYQCSGNTDDVNLEVQSEASLMATTHEEGQLTSASLQESGTQSNDNAAENLEVRSEASLVATINDERQLMVAKINLQKVGSQKTVEVGKLLSRVGDDLWKKYWKKKY